MLLPLSCLILLSAIAATSTSIQVFAHTDKYYIGYSQGQTKATADYYVNGHNDYNPRCPTNDAWNQANGPHRGNFCAGFIAGYNAQWTTLAPDVMQRIQQSASLSSGINIKGSNNDVTVNQQVNNNIGGQNGHSSYQPRCAILCSIIRVN
jgi:hypothetical protein